MIKQYYGYEEFLNDIKALSSILNIEKPDAIVAIARGGVTLGHFLSQSLEIRDFYTINSQLYDDTKKRDQHSINSIPDLSKFTRIVLVDDIVDSGETMKNINEVLKNKFPQLTIKTLSLFYKKSAIITADYSIHETKNWIEFFWEKDI